MPLRRKCPEEEPTMLDAHIYNALRTPFGRHAGALARMRPDDMLAAVISEVVKQSPFDPEKIEDVVVGCANQAGEDSRCVGRHAGLLAGLPIEVAGSVLQRNCCSGLNAILMAAPGFSRGRALPWRCRAVGPVRSRSPKTSTRARRPIWRHSPSYGRCRRAVSRPPATPPASTTVRWR